MEAAGGVPAATSAATATAAAVAAPAAAAVGQVQAQPVATLQARAVGAQPPLKKANLGPTPHAVPGGPVQSTAFPSGVVYVTTTPTPVTATATAAPTTQTTTVTPVTQMPKVS